MKAHSLEICIYRITFRATEILVQDRGHLGPTRGLVINFEPALSSRPTQDRIHISAIMAAVNGDMLAEQQRIIPMRLVIVRHGESEWNRIGRYQGQSDAPLSDLGLRQAEALAGRLRDEPLDVIFTSALQRAAKTAEAIARYHRNTPLEHTPALLEIHHGDWQGLLADEVI